MNKRRESAKGYNDLILNTVRIEMFKKGVITGSGTGFIFAFHADKEKGLIIPTIVTNKHVVDASDECKFYMTLSDESGKPAYGKKVAITVNRSRWIYHPDEKIDLCMCPVPKELNELKAKGNEVYLVYYDKNVIPLEQDINDLNFIEDVTIIGYPNGIWDEVNNIPIIRKGITATPLSFDYKGNPFFLVDAAIYPGSSGSPVFILNQGSFEKKGQLYLGNRFKFIGIIFRVYQHDSFGEVVPIEIPTSTKLVSLSQVPNNLGMAIKSSALLDFEPLLL